jgi:hypothetical protein
MRSHTREPPNSPVTSLGHGGHGGADARMMRMTPRPIASHATDRVGWMKRRRNSTARNRTQRRLRCEFGIVDAQLCRRRRRPLLVSIATTQPCRRLLTSIFGRFGAWRATVSSAVIRTHDQPNMISLFLHAYASSPQLVMHCNCPTLIGMLRLRLRT